MKIQSLAVIFIIIILPISLVLASYTQNRVETLRMQTSYDSKLNDATHDALKAYQLNSFSSDTASYTNSKIRDIKASVNTFFTSMATNFSTLGYTKDTLQNYVPAIVYTMYDGYYIYSPYTNTWWTDGANSDIQDQISQQIPTQNTYGNDENLYGLKPYIYYSCRYKKGSSLDVVITYSLDNYVQIQGLVDGKAVNKYGYLLSDVSVNGENVTYKGINITSEHLKENVYVDGAVKELSYIKLGGTKYYTDGSSVFSILNGKSAKGQTVTIEDITNNQNAKKYYKEAKELQDFITNSGLSGLTTSDAVKSNNEEDYTNIGKIFDFNNIESETSNFNSHRIEVIKHSIERNLSVAISNFNNYSGVSTDFQMPKLKEDDWDKIMDNVSIISFFQGANIGGKIYNGYSIITNTENEDVVMGDSIYLKDSNNICHRFTEDFATTGVNTASSIGILNVNTEKRSAEEENGQKLYYYPVNCELSYDSIITQNRIKKSDSQSLQDYISTLSNDLQSKYYTALARERYGLYRGRNVIN